MIGLLCRVMALVAVGWLAMPAQAAPRTEHVFIISIDGGSPAVMQQSKMPVLKKLASEGACTWTATTVIPLTLPAHTSMLTGVGTNRHKITWNGWIPTNGLVQVPTVFAAAKSAGFSTAMAVGKEKFRHLLQPNTVDWFDYDAAHSVVILKSDDGSKAVKTEGNVPALTVADHAADYIVRHKPNLCFIHLADPDTVGHIFGWGSPEQRKALADTDAALGIIMKGLQQAGIAEHSVILLTADHGGHGKGHSQGTGEDVTIPWLAWGQGVKPGFPVPGPVSNCDVAATALWLLDVPPPCALDAKAVTCAFE
jgi:predicted AlkP superfamily pyrophosphatase or phosphodiesterase